MTTERDDLGTARTPSLLSFECTQCGQCCTRRGKYAHVYVSEDEVTALARQCGISRRRFTHRHTFVDEYGWRQLLFDGQACPFFEERSGRCRVYSVRPLQCSTFPFWKEMIGESGWTAEARALCEGLGRGKRYTRAEVVSFFREMDERESE